MKKLVKVFALAALMMLGGQAMAQVYRGALFLGASFPMNEFASFSSFDEYALMKMEANDAGAAVGFNTGVKLYFNVGLEGLSAMVSADGFYNGQNADLKAAFRDNESSYNYGELLNGSFKYEETPKYFNLPIMVGLNYLYHFNPNFGFFIEAGAGGNFGFITDLGTMTKGQFLGQERIYRDNTDYDNTFTFAYQAGVGFEVAKNLVISCSLYNLGNADVKAELTHKVIINQDSATDSKEYKTYGTIHPVMIVGRIGFNF